MSSVFTLFFLFVTVDVCVSLRSSQLISRNPEINNWVNPNDLREIQMGDHCKANSSSEQLYYPSGYQYLPLLKNN